MRAFARIAVAAMVVGCASPAAADPVQITSGSFAYLGGIHSFSQITLEGTRGFTFAGFVGFGFFPAADCVFPECVSGEAIDLRAHWSGGDLPGTATVDGATYHAVGSASSDSSASVDFSGTLFAPTAGNGPVQQSTPFSFVGLFAVFEPRSTRIYDLEGAGVATATFSRHPGTDAWRIDRLQYDFLDPALAPEPSTLGLVGLGAVAAAARRRRRGKT